MKGLLSSLLDYIQDFFSFFSDVSLPSIKQFLGIVADVGFYGNVFGAGQMSLQPVLVGFCGIIFAVTIIKLLVNR